MLPIEGRPILTAAQMRAAEKRAARTPEAMYVLMERAGAGVADAVRRLAAGAEVLVLCGPGNNGGDGYVAARVLRDAGVSVRVAATRAPTTKAAKHALAGWGGTVEQLDHSLIDRDAPGPVLVDAIFGTGLSRPVDEGLADVLDSLMPWARLSIAVDLPTGVDSDSGAPLSAWVGRTDLTLALGALKPAHLLQPAAARCGAVRLIDLGLDLRSDVHVLQPPHLPPPGPDAQKFTRGMVAVVPGPMHGAALLASEAAMRAGAGYVLLLDGGEGAPHALVRKPWSADALGDARIGAVLIGNGLGRDDEARARVGAALMAGKPLVVDGDALHLVTPGRLADHGAPLILTPHAGEFAALFGKGEVSKIERTRVAARAANAVVIHKGADTVIAAPDGRVAVAGQASSWLSTAGSGDVLAGTTAAMLAGGGDPFEAAQAAVWLHAEAARRCGASFIADDLAAALTPARASLCR